MNKESFSGYGAHSSSIEKILKGRKKSKKGRPML